MLKLVNITKKYELEDYQVEALKGVNLEFREAEFVAVLGPSGCGKTTLLNIIGGLDRYTEGDLIINGRSTKDYKDRDWDTYRNHSIGFVFQSYNLIPHLNVLSNVELALTISGISREERRKRAVEALEKVGLGDQLKKKPNQLSGGQSQRVAIARALVTNPDIILADEPTGALDSETSVIVMELLKEISHDKLVIMVTHNPDLAEQYATRIVRMKDGLTISDSHVYEAALAKATPSQPPSVKSTEASEASQATSSAASTASAPPKAPAKTGRAKMSYGTAFMISLKNLTAKKGRTILTSFAGSIGIIGIALIFALSNGIQVYVNMIQEDTLSAYPITIEAEQVDTTQMLTDLMQPAGDDQSTEADGKIHSRNVFYQMMSSVANVEAKQNNLPPFKTYLDSSESIRQYTSAVQYSYNINPPIYTTAPDGTIMKADIMDLMEQFMDENSTQLGLMEQFSPLGQVNQFQEMVPGESGELISPMVTSQYDLVTGQWPTKYDEVVLILNSRNEISDMALYTLGLKDPEEINQMMEKMAAGEEIAETPSESWTYDEVMNKKFKLVLPGETYAYNESSATWQDVSTTDAGKDYLYNSEEVGFNFHITGIIKPSPDASARILNGSIGYTTALTNYIIERNNSSDILQQQKADETVDVFNGLPFRTADYIEPTAAEKATSFSEWVLTNTSTLSAEDAASAKAAYYTFIQGTPSNAELASMVDEQMAELTRAQIEENVTTQYATEMGVDEATVQDYIRQMDDATLFSYVREALTSQISEQYRQQAEAGLASMDEAQLASLFDQTTWTEEQLGKLYDEFMPPVVSEGALAENLKLLGDLSLDSPTSIYIYASTFRDKDAIAAEITAYNEGVAEADQITYTDYVALLMSSITDILSGITYLLIAFVAISLVVSSIMIGIITYISVLERTKEIGILRAIGASKGDISNVFNAETFIEGLSAGILGVGIAWLLTIPINSIVQSLTGIPELAAILPWEVGVALVIISVLLTTIAGLIPSRMAAKKDPVEALRTE